MSVLFGERAIPSSLSYSEVRPLLRWVYAWMFLGLLVTAAVAFLTSTSEALLALRTSPAVVFGSFFAQIGLVLVISLAIRRLSPALAATLFMVYAAINGFVFSMILLYFDIGSVFAAFATTSIVFGAMSIVGYTTETDLTKLGGFLMMALIGLIVAMIVNIFLGSSTMDFIISIIGVLIFTALTAYDTQKIKRMAADAGIQNDSTLVARLSVLGALTLYLDFVNLFLFLLRLMGGGSRD
jgi:FtsH-binding integral membrane protein